MTKIQRAKKLQKFYQERGMVAVVKYLEQSIKILEMREKKFSPA
jgi:hypothetical protein